MTRHVMICGVDCQKGDRYCNGYCMGKSPMPPDALPEMVVLRLRDAAYIKLFEAKQAWLSYSDASLSDADRHYARHVFDRLNEIELK